MSSSASNLARRAERMNACENCLKRGKVVEYDVKLADGTQLCYDCADAGNGKVNEQ
jgi:hypothetical protein